MYVVSDFPEALENLQPMLGEPYRYLLYFLILKLKLHGVCSIGVTLLILCPDFTCS